jgi:DNA-binding SARP family transcriptional activator
MRFKVLGLFEVFNGPRTCTPSAPKVRQLLAALVLRANHVVGQDDLIDEIWGADAPMSAVTTLQTYVYHLRKILQREFGRAEADRMVVTKPPGYLLSVDERQVDLFEFNRLFDEGRAALANDDPRGAADRLRSALAMWNGAPLANVTCGSLLETYVAHLAEKRTTALEMRVAADVRLGRCRELVPELKMLVKAHPFNEWLYSQLIIALRESGRRAEALDAYQEVRGHLKDELGLDPSRDLQRTHQDVLTSDEWPSSMRSVS